MKFKAQAGGLLAGIKPMIAVATKGTQKDYPNAGLITFKSLINYVEVIADGGHVSSSNEISNETYNLDYVCENDGTATVNAVDLHSSLSSFPATSILSFEVVDNAGGRELSIRDNDEIQTLPIQNIHCEYVEPVHDKKSKQVSITLRRETFISYANKISFAHGYTQECKEYTYWVLKALSENEIRFVAGSGMRFAVVELLGSNITDAKNSSTILFPNDQTQPILSVLSDLKCQDVTITAQDRTISIICNKTKICLYTCDPDVVWPDEEKFLRRSSKFLFTTQVNKWKNAVKGIVATNNEDVRKQNKMHSCILNVDLANKLIQTKTEMTLKSSRKVLIDDFATNEDQTNFVIKCSSAYINELISKGSDDGFLQFEIENPNTPVVIRYYASQNVGDHLTFSKAIDDGTRERYTIFFATVKD